MIPQLADEVVDANNDFEEPSEVQLSHLDLKKKYIDIFFFCN